MNIQHTRSTFIKTERGRLEITYKSNDFNKDFEISPRQEDGEWIKNPYILKLPKGIVAKDLGNRVIELSNGTKTAPVYIGQHTNFEIEPNQVTLIERYPAKNNGYADDGCYTFALHRNDADRSLSRLYAAYTYVKGDEGKDKPEVPVAKKPSRRELKKLHKN